MEILSHYRQVITSLLNNLAEACAQEHVKTLPLFDTTRENYLLLDAGRDGTQRIHHIIPHLRIHNAKIWVEADNTDQELIQHLLEVGIAKEAIALAF